MSQSLKSVLQRLEQIITPPTSYTNGTVVLYPDATESGPVADLKRDIWGKCVAVLDTGKAWLSRKQPLGLRHLSGNESDKAESVLAQDSECRAFQEAVMLAQTAENLLHEAAA
ncbi:hypothetical protein LN565_19595 [Xanthomonas euvesicatoria pv. euvesicatoria]|uniref:hypothetical protein n=2 Tax=Xanthomonas TaxID=338 RepID=UPI000AAC6A28|nr:hypothetical protein [Xanthomonas euvesicatoria]MBV6690288.1 hypothetical protein [Xanthomonas euvesicatoria pv. physalidis]MBV6889612.1 hypothetical protein [Xanthomonas campestris pv. spermacoces]MCC8504992.1 hypothetical protein [Xanthomonas euvesicatoria pv. euvesicatoria]MCC8543608.1 hypothetical protein [Xanthomonas euvesicatoria pv. euvesicatoria]MCC8572946.1 hypothetical protein [Xanthomonas euvesicatoria pv. euvesicatoria]